MAPRKVMLLRHGEKLGDSGDDHVGGPNLSVRGTARAAAIPSLFLPGAQATSCRIEAANGTVSTAFVQEPIAGPPPRFDMPDVIFATADSHASCRPRQTALPTAVALGKPFDCTTYPNSATAQFGADLLDASHDGQTILVFWHHGTMGALAAALGVPNAPAWPGHAIFDRVWLIDFGLSPPAVDDQPQSLLFGDA